MNERRRILHDDGGADVVTLSVTTTDGSTNVGIEMVVLNNGTYYNVTTDAQGKAELAGLSGGCTITCETYELDVTQFTATGTMTVSINAYLNTFPIGTVRSYGYTENYQEASLIPGTYRMQVWGAQGGSNGTYSTYGITAQSGGYGGYSEGIITLLQNTTVRVYVGGQGSSSSGGYNGGGDTSGTSQYNSGNTFGYSKMGGGGGATDIRLSDGALLSRMIVAGGGAGGAMCYKKVTSTSTTWVSIGSCTSVTVARRSGWNSNQGRISVTAGDYVRFKPVKTDTSPYNGIQVYWQDSSGTMVTTYTTGITFNSWTGVTVPSGAVTALIESYTTTDDAPPQFTCSAEKQTTTTTTNTYNESQVGGVGGGTQGGAYSSTYAGKQNAAGSGGAFGQGANQTTTYYRYCSGAGGGGWYGGGGGSYSDSSTTNCRYSGGGSGFVNTAANAQYRPSGYTGLELDSGLTIAGSSTFESTSGGRETGHAGNGYAKITRLNPSTLVPLTFDILESGTIGWKNVGGSYIRTIEYSKNGGAWTSITSTTSGVTIQVDEGDVIQFRGNNTYYSYSTSYYNSFTATCRFNVRGNVMSLVDVGVVSTSLSSSYALGYLFYGNTKLVDASGMMLPATTLSSCCYYCMFYGCTAMTKAPEILPAMTLQSFCYQYMFYGCTSLTTAPELPAQTLTSYCYQYMFYNCSSLNRVEAAFTTTPSTSYTSSWLSGVAATGTFVKNGAATWTSTGVSAIPTGWTVECHNDEKGYFTIESLEDNNTIYWYNNSGATSKTIYWAKGNTAFTGVSSTTSGATLTTLNRGEKLYIWGSNSNYASSTSYYCYFMASANYKVYGNIMSLINGNTFSTLTYLSFYYVFAYLFFNDTHLVDASGLLLPATALDYGYVYYGMFCGCTGLTAGPEKLPATSLTTSCYAYMFYNCTSLTTAPVLPATSLYSYCYNYMFYGCSSLKYIKAMFTTTPSSSYTSNWVNGVAATGTFVKNSSATWNVTGENGVPSGWTIETAST